MTAVLTAGPPKFKTTSHSKASYLGNWSPHSLSHDLLLAGLANAGLLMCVLVIIVGREGESASHKPGEQSAPSL
jgi:hypothetical protein